MAKEKKIVMNPPAELEPRSSDVVIPVERYVDLSLFALLKSKPTLERFPGAFALRRFRKGEVICRQGEAGWTAFYLLTAEDVLALTQIQAAEARDERKRRQLEEEVTAQQKRLAALQGKEATDPGRAAATVHLAIARPRKSGAQGVLARLAGVVLGGRTTTTDKKPLYIPIDGPADIPYDSLQAPMYEGELFGEMSCLYGTPRSATIVADRDCYLLEMIRNLFDAIAGDKGFKDKMDAAYKSRVLQNQLRSLSIFNEMTNEQFARIRQRVELIRCKDGQLICDEHERSDSMYVIRSGLVKVLKGASSLLAANDVADWKVLGGLLAEGSAAQTPVSRYVAGLLPVPVRTQLGRAAVGETLTEGEQADVRQALNGIICDPKLSAAKELQELVGSATAQAQAADFPAKRDEWTELQRRQFNRWLLEAACPGALRSRQRQGGPEVVLAYRARGEFIGEIGLITGQPRSATCVAYVHPRPGGGQAGPVDKWRREAERVELVKIPEAAFRELIETAPSIRKKVEQVVAERRQSDIQRQRVPVWDSGGERLLSGRAEELGLIQGQKLMLIDLDRCTRCDECVRACVDTHGDGYSRLFLDGPRFENYLVPASCRACLDPVCMIGCPVGSIHRGDNNQMVIENWCIGCGLCEKNCPYGSIQMHDIGIIPEEGHGWRYCPAGLAGARWNGLKHTDRHWTAGRAPFVNDADFQANLKASAAEGPDTAICFRYEFRPRTEVVRTAAQFTLEVTSTDADATVWLNGKEVPKPPEKPKRGMRMYVLPQDAQWLLAGRNVLAVKATPTPGSGEVLLAVRLDEVRKPAKTLGLTGDISEKGVTAVAVVCDLCSQQYGQRPACVNACPHDAAIRVNARFEFPVE
jgi:Fe-S-cluster-containing hydrogenase component 2/CRP-like cAMP-binding protein